LSQSNFSTHLDSQQHHSIYAPEPNYELLVRKNIHGFHLAIDRDYYAGLLCEYDPRTARIKEKLLNREQIWQGIGIVDAGMKQALLEIFNNPMSGKLRSLLIEAKVLELVVLQLDQLSTHRTPLAIRRGDADVFYEVRQFLEQHYREQLSLRGISKTFGINEFKLKKGFKELFKTTIFEYVHDLKMGHARELLLDGKMYVNEVSHHIGYKNANHFSTAFKRKFGMSPSGLR
ncbi:MAG TPA: AraC family transcriptional regulator, partial [Ohtaekwangia sp.]|nr:AraC family transcriptional regulator [Ohtaekwangia sp.]